MTHGGEFHEASLVGALARWIIPRLADYEQHQMGEPALLAEGVFPTLLAQMRAAFELIARDNGAWDWTAEERATVEQGLNAFRYWMLDLWC